MITVTTVLTCNECGVEFSTRPTGAHGEALGLRDKAARSGWKVNRTYNENRDMCPYCKNHDEGSR